MLLSGRPGLTAVEQGTQDPAVRRALPSRHALMRCVVVVSGTKKFEHRVYDKQRGSFPYRIAELAQDHASEKDAQPE